MNGNRYFFDTNAVIALLSGNKTIEEKLKIESKLKLPDAIIAGYAIQNQAILISNDRHFEGINKLSLLRF